MIANTDLIARRRRWSYSLVRKAKTPVPAFGSEDWWALEEGCAEKIAAVVVAAEAWACRGDTLEEDLRLEVEQASLLAKQAEDAEYVAGYKAHRRQYRHLRLMVTDDPLLLTEPQTPRPLEEIGREYMADLVAQRRERAGDHGAG